MLQADKIIPAVVVAVFLIQGAIAFPVANPEDYYYNYSSSQYNDYSLSSFQTEESFNFAIVASGPSLSDYQAYKNGEPVSISQLPDSFTNINPLKFDPFFNEDSSFMDDIFKNFNALKFDPLFNDATLFGDPFTYFM